MRVLHVHSGNLFGGVERMMQALAPANAGRSPIDSSFALCFEGQVADTLRAADAEVHGLGPVRTRRPDEVRRARRALQRILDDVGPDVALVHSAWSQAIFGPPIRQSGTPLVRWLHAPSPGPLWMETWARRAHPALVLCNSRYTFENVCRRFGDSQLVVQHPPISMPMPAPGTRAAVRATVGSRPEAVVIVLAARLEAGKGHGVLIEALAQLRSSRWETWIVGGVQQHSEQKYLDGLRWLGAARGLSGRIRFLGQRTDVHGLLAGADIYCQPNTAPDSFGLSFVEALAAGLPVITTSLGAAPEVLDETCGVLVGPGSSALAAALQALVDDDDGRRQMSTAAQRRARAFCDLPGAVSQLADHLSRVVTVPLAHA